MPFKVSKRLCDYVVRAIKKEKIEALLPVFYLPFCLIFLWGIFCFVIFFRYKLNDYSAHY